MIKKTLSSEFRICYDCKQPYQALLSQLNCPFCKSNVWDNLHLFKRNEDGTVTIN